MPTPADPRIADRLRARRARIVRIRKRALASAAGTFVLAWGVIFMQLVSGHDPALAKHSTAASTNAAGASGGASPVTTSASGSRSASSGGASSGSVSSGSATAAPASSGSDGTSALTTSQS